MQSAECRVTECRVQSAECRVTDDLVRLPHSHTDRFLSMCLLAYKAGISSLRLKPQPLAQASGSSLWLKEPACFRKLLKSLWSSSKANNLHNYI